MNIFKYITIAIVLVTAMAGCDKNNEALCNEKDMGEVVLMLNEYLACQPDEWDADEKFNDLRAWLGQYRCIRNPRQVCQNCLTVSIIDGANNPFGHELRMDFRGKEYALYLSAKNPFRIVDHTELSIVEPDMSDPAKAILGMWEHIAIVNADGDTSILKNSEQYWYYIMDFLSNGSYRAYYHQSYRQAPPSTSAIMEVGRYHIYQEFLMQNRVVIGDYTLYDLKCNKYSFLGEDKLKIESCAPLPQSWTDIYQRVK